MHEILENIESALCRLSNRLSDLEDKLDKLDKLTTSLNRVAKALEHNSKEGDNQ